MSCTSHPTRFAAPARRLGRFALALACLVAPALAHAGDAGTGVAADSAQIAAPPDSGAATAAATDSAIGSTGVAGTGANPHAASVRKVRLIQAEQNVVRSGPGAGYSIVGVYPRGTTFPVIAKRGEWYGVRVSDSATGWIHASLCKEFDDLSDLEFRPNPKLYSRTGSYILSAYTGGYAFDRKSNSLVVGGRLGYYAFDRVQVEGGVGWTHVHRPAEIVETLFGLSLEAEDFHMLFYHLIATYELLPGRQMVPYATVGVGSAIFRGDSEASFDFGGGTMLYVSKRTAVRWEVRDYNFHSGTASARRANNNIAFTMGTSVLF